MMFSRLSQLATSLGTVQTSGWFDQESILAFIFMSFGCLFICLFIYLLYCNILCMLALHSIWHIYCFHILVGLLCCDLFLIGWELQEVKGLIPQPRDTWDT